MKLGNMSLNEASKEMGIEFNEEFKTEMNQYRQENIADGLKESKSWHIFAIPFVFMATKDLAKTIMSELLPKSKSITNPIQLEIHDMTDEELQKISIQIIKEGEI